MQWELEKAFLAEACLLSCLAGSVRRPGLGRAKGRVLPDLDALGPGRVPDRASLAAPLLLFAHSWRENAAPRLLYEDSPIIFS